MLLIAALLVLGTAAGRAQRRRVVVPQKYVISESQRRASLTMPLDTSFNQPLDMNIDFRYFLIDPDRTCLNDGDRVPLNFGGPADATNCTVVFPNGNWTQSALQPNCTIVCDSDDVISAARLSYFRELLGEVHATLEMVPPIKSYCFSFFVAVCVPQATSYISRSVNMLPQQPPGSILVNTTTDCGFFGGAVPVRADNVTSRATGSYLCALFRLTQRYILPRLLISF